ncbi:hypothetical protein HK098_003306 [Nowakowskiella sp. JEL0407]|nr:hypothetical protein HK098_003306 [Nowakowskiella sp. JEL0407]
MNNEDLFAFPLLGNNFADTTNQQFDLFSLQESDLQQQQDLFTTLSFMDLNSANNLLDNSLGPDFSIINNQLISATGRLEIQQPRLALPPPPISTATEITEPFDCAKIRRGCSACDRCYIRKIKCDMQLPKCGHCVSKHESCTYKRLSDPDFGSHRSKNIKGKHTIPNSSSAPKSHKPVRVKRTSADAQSIRVAKSTTSSASEVEWFPPDIPVPNYRNEFFAVSKNSNSSTNSFPSFPKFNTLPFPVDVLDELILGYFPNASWPMNVVHPKSFISNRFNRSEALLMAICAYGCRYTEMGDKLRGTGQDVSDMFFRRALGALNIERPSLDDGCTLVLLINYAINAGKVNTMLHLSTIGRIFAKHIQLCTDPTDPLAIPKKHNWNIVQKETMRRLYWAFTATGLVTHPSKNPNRPIPDHAWLQLSEDDYGDTPQFRPVGLQLESSDINYLACDTGVHLNRIREKLLQSPCALGADLKIDLAAQEIRGRLNAWEERIKLVAPLNDYFSSSSSAAWMGLYLHIIKHSIMLLAHRYLMVRFLEQATRKSSARVLETQNRTTSVFNMLQHDSPNASKLSSSSSSSNPPQYSHIESMILRKNLETEALQQCHNATRSSIHILKNILLVFNPLLKEVHSSLPLCLIQVCVYLGVLAQNADSEASRQEALRDYAFLKSLLRALAKGSSKVAGKMVEGLDGIEVKGWASMKDQLLTFFTWDVAADHSRLD